MIMWSWSLPFFVQIFLAALTGGFSSSAAGRSWSEDVVRIVCISDTHSLETYMQPIPDGDVLIHAGDFSNVGTFPEVVRFAEFVSQLPHPQKIVIAGNHDITMQPDFYRANGHRFHPHQFRSAGFDALQYSEKSQEAVRSSVSPSFTYLQDNSTLIVPPVGAPVANSRIEVYGAPWQPEFNNWAFNLPPGPELKAKWDMIPDTTDVLITHGPPYSILDRLLEGDLTGCQQLRDAVARVRPRLHIFGHIHEGYGEYICLEVKGLCAKTLLTCTRM